jgi:hypothetical protein
LSIRIARSVFGLLAVVLPLAHAGCGSSSPRATRSTRATSAPFTVPQPSFPTRASLRAALPTAAPTSADTGVVVARWDMAPSSLALAPSPFDALYAQVASARPTAQRSDAFACFATEIARFTAANGGLPTDALRAYVGARCGVTSTAVSIGALPASLHGAPSDDALFAQLGPALLERAIPMIPEAADRLGFGIARDGDQFVVAVAAGLAETEVVPSRPIGESGRVRFVLRASLPVDRLVALANEGETGVSLCTVSGQAPDVAIDCPYVPDGDRVRIEVALREGESVMLRPLAMLVAVADPSQGLTYATRSGATATPLDPTTLAATVVPLLNGIRSRAGLAALALDAAQSAANAEVAPSFFTTEDPAVRDQIVLYAMAGWDVEGAICEGRATAMTTLGATDAASWLYGALEEPIERYVLLDPGARSIAFGATSAGAAAHAIVSTYRFFETDAASERAQILGALDRARAARGLGPATFFGVAELERAADAVEAGALGPDDALAQAADASLPRLQHLRPFLGASSDLDRVVFPSEVVGDPTGRVAIAVAHWQPEGAAWGVYLVLGMIVGG